MVSFCGEVMGGQVTIELELNDHVECRQDILNVSECGMEVSTMKT